MRKLYSFMVTTLDGFHEGPDGEFDWENSELVSGDPLPVIEQLEQRPGEGDIALFGSSTFTASLLDAGVVDEIGVMVMPVLLGGGVSLFTGLTKRVPLRLSRTTTFRNGNVMLYDAPENRQRASIWVGGTAGS
jgi:dihydrofolate reductase